MAWSFIATKSVDTKLTRRELFGTKKNSNYISTEVQYFAAEVLVTKLIINSKEFSLHSFVCGSYKLIIICFPMGFNHHKNQVWHYEKKIRSKQVVQEFCSIPTKPGKQFCSRSTKPGTIEIIMRWSAIRSWQLHNLHWIPPSLACNRQFTDHFVTDLRARQSIQILAGFVSSEHLVVYTHSALHARRV